MLSQGAEKGVHHEFAYGKANRRAKGFFEVLLFESVLRKKKGHTPGRHWGETTLGNFPIEREGVARIRTGIWFFPLKEERKKNKGKI